MRHISQAGIELIKKFEGFYDTPYLCPAGYWTIGYGHMIMKDEGFEVITLNEAEILLKKDVLVAERAVVRLIDVPLIDGQFDALVSFTFNLGAGSLQASTLRRKLNRGDYAAIPDELKRWVWSNGRKLKGLVRRRQASAHLFISNI